MPGSGITFVQLCQIAGGIVLFLYGLELASENLKAVAGARLKVILRLLTGNRFAALLAGALGTVLVQSNTAMAIVLVGLCEAGAMTLARSIGVLLGANLGSTLTVQVVAFDLYPYALLVIALGFLAASHVPERRLRVAGALVAAAGVWLVLTGAGTIGAFCLVAGAAAGACSFAGERKAAGRALIGLGLLFVGLTVMKTAMAHLRQDPAFLRLVVTSQLHPILVVVLAFVLTVVTNSSTATLGLAIALVSVDGAGSAGAVAPVLTSEGMTAIVLGAHLGSCPVTILSAKGRGHAARQVAAAHVFVKVVGVAMVYPLLQPFCSLLVWLNSGMGAGAARAVANTHTLFNLVNVLAVLPFAPGVARLLDRVIPEAKGEAPGVLRHIGPEQMEVHSVAIEGAELEVQRMAFLVRALIQEMLPALSAETSARLEDLERRDDEIDELCASLVAFTSRLGERELDATQFRRLMTVVYVIGHLEAIGDRVSKDFRSVMTRRMEADAQFSLEGLKLLGEAHKMLVLKMDSLVAIFCERDHAHIARILEGHGDFQAGMRTFTKAHFRQLVRSVQAAQETTMLYLDVLAVMQNIERAIVDIAQNLRYSGAYDIVGSSKGGEGEEVAGS